MISVLLTLSDRRSALLANGESEGLMGIGSTLCIVQSAFDRPAIVKIETKEGQNDTMAERRTLLPLERLPDIRIFKMECRASPG
jgi:hypothetical protein